MWDDLADGILWVLDYGQALIAALLTYTVVRIKDGRDQSATDDRIAEELNENLRRWVRDTDRDLNREHLLITARYRNPDSVPEWREQVPQELRHLPAGSQYHSGAHLSAHAAAQALVLHRYRDEATLQQRAFNAQFEREGWLHRFWRERRGRPAPRLSLPQDCRDILARWRAPYRLADVGEASVEDVSGPDLEPALASIEAGPAPSSSGR